MKSELPNKKMFSFKRLRKSFVYAGSGIKASLKREQKKEEQPPEIIFKQVVVLLSVQLCFLCSIAQISRVI